MKQAILKELNRFYERKFLCFKKRGLVLKYKGDLKDFFKEYSITNEMEFSKHFYDFRDEVLISNGLDEMSFCVDNDLLYPQHFGLTNVPLFGFGGSLWGQEEYPARFIFAYSSYVFFDFVEELIKNGEVCFDCFIDNTEAHDRALSKNRCS
ncbi:hypothetical protein [Campylobacter helveticus]|uniref:hypothetical protein n=1 Tax=Campylobacter helveticus TaxID=28898 RepID=UPI0022EB1620|nr:hypothetical protein [Campylobacter helveticus]